MMDIDCGKLGETEMSEWKIYEGTDEQIEEIFNAGGYVYRNDKGYESSILMAVGKREELISELNDDNVTHYLICKKHPLADMIIRQAQTGQPVYIRMPHWASTNILVRMDCTIVCDNGITTTIVTNVPRWDLPNAEYRLSPFED